MPLSAGNMDEGRSDAGVDGIADQRTQRHASARQDWTGTDDPSERQKRRGKEINAGHCSRTRIVALAVSFEAADVLLAIELHAKLFDELQLGLQKIDVFFFINQKVVIKLLGDEVMS